MLATAVTARNEVFVSNPEHPQNCGKLISLITSRVTSQTFIDLDSFGRNNGILTKT